MSELRIVVVGLGSIGSRHVNTLLSMGHRDLVAVDPRQMPNEERLPVVTCFDEVDWWKPTHALICTPPELHYPHAKHFIDRGVRTFIEKPMAANLSRSRTLCATAHMQKQNIAVGYMERAHPTVLRAKAWAAARTVGYGTIECYWRSTSKTYPLDVCAESSHVIDTARFLLGDIRTVRMRSKSAVSADIDLSLTQAPSCTVVMHMDAKPAMRRITLYTGSESFSEEYGLDAQEWDACYEAELQAFLDGKPLCTVDDGVAVMEVLEQLR